MVAGCGAKISKLILFVLNFLVWLVGIGLIVIGAVVLANADQYDALFGTDTNLLTIVCGMVIGLGCFIFLLGFAGCCGAVKESSCLLKVYIAVLVLLVILEIIGGILAFVFRGRIEEFLEDTMRNQVRKNYGKSDQEVITKFYDTFQQKLDCCGGDDYLDYKGSAFQDIVANVLDFVPKSCCKDETSTMCNKKNAAETDIGNANLIYTRGCSGAIVEFFKDSFLYIGAAALALVAFEILASIFACCVVSGISSGDYE